MPINEVINKIFNRFTETIFLKEKSELEYQVQVLKNLLEKYPNNKKLLNRLKLCELGLQGEKEIEFELKNANIGMYVLHDVNIEYKDLKAQIDYIIITPAKIYLVECKNLVGNITIDNKGNFIREYQYENRKIKEGIYSPVTQAQRHLEILKKIWMDSHIGILDKTIRLKNFEHWRKPLVVLSNSKCILNDKYAPKQIKDIVIKSDRLVDYLKKDIEETDKDLLSNEKEMREDANKLINEYNKEIDKDYEKEFEELIRDENNKIKEPIQNDTSKVLEIRNKLLEFRKTKSKEKNIPPYYIFNNDELDRILITMPKSKEELKKSNILTEVKLKLHGDEIVRIINK